MPALQDLQDDLALAGSVTGERVGAEGGALSACCRCVVLDQVKVSFVKSCSTSSTTCEFKHDGSQPRLSGGLERLLNQKVDLVGYPREGKKYVNIRVTCFLPRSRPRGPAAGRPISRYAPLSSKVATNAPVALLARRFDFAFADDHFSSEQRLISSETYLVDGCACKVVNSRRAKSS